MGAEREFGSKMRAPHPDSLESSFRKDEREKMTKALSYCLQKKRKKRQKKRDKKGYESTALVIYVSYDYKSLQPRKIAIHLPTCICRSMTLLKTKPGLTISIYGFTKSLLTPNAQQGKSMTATSCITQHFPRRPNVTSCILENRK